MVSDWNEKNLKREIKSKNTLLVNFWAPWCVHCKLMNPVFEKISEEFKGKIKCGRINSKENPKIAEEFHVFGIPTVIIFKEGKEKGRIIGFDTEEELRNKIEKIVNLS